jgi:hypothetical protein
MRVSISRKRDKRNDKDEDNSSYLFSVLPLKKSEIASSTR